MSAITREELLDSINAQDELPEAVKECEKSIKEDQPELNKSQRIAICRDQLDLQDEGGCPEGQAKINGECVEIEESALPQARPLSNGVVFTLQNLDTAPIEREELGNGLVAFRNMRLLDTGVWTDSASETPTLYGERGMENLEAEWDTSEYDGPPVNIMHDANFETGEVNEASIAGYVEPDSLTVENGALYGDIVLDTTINAGGFADDNLQTALGSGGAVGFGGPSVELDIDPSEHLEPTDHSRAESELTGGRLTGVGLVMDPASKASTFARQTAEKGVALSNGQSDKATYMKPEGMSDETLGADALLEALDLEAEELDLGENRELADVPVMELVSLIAEAYGADPADLMDALDPFINGEGEEQEMQEEEEEEEETEEDEGEDDVDVDVEMVQALEERISALEDMVDSMVQNEDLEELEDAKEELEAELADAEKRLEALEEEPEKPRTLSGENGNGEAEVTGRISPIETRRRY